MISYGKQSIEQSDIDAVVEVLKGDWIIQGPAVEKFENDLKSYFCAKHCCAVANGTAALHLTALALGWNQVMLLSQLPSPFLQRQTVSFTLGEHLILRILIQSTTLKSRISWKTESGLISHMEKP